MYKIQTQKTIEHPLIIPFPTWECDNKRWGYHAYLTIDNDAFTTITGSTTKEHPFSAMGYNGTNYNQALNQWKLNFYNESRDYYDNFVRPFMASISFMNDNYIKVFKELYEEMLDGFKNIKEDYYDISVGDDEVGNTWKKADITADIPEFKTQCYRTKIVRGINKNKLNIITTNQTPTQIRCYFLNQSEDIMTLYLYYAVAGEHKEINEETGELIRTPIRDIGTYIRLIFINTD